MIGHQEHRLQVTCVHWFRFQYPWAARHLFAVPNGGERNIAVAYSLKREGVLAGVADIMLALPSGRWHGLFIEMKTKSGRQSTAQKAFQRAVESSNYRYMICRSLEDFIRALNAYMSEIAASVVSSVKYADEVENNSKLMR